MTAVSRETHRVELVDPAGGPVGSSTVEVAHRAPGRLHRAFSVFLRAPDGRVLLQQRAAVKTRFPLRWANTCCGHPEPGEDVAVAAARRLVEEIGVAGIELTEVGRYSYYAVDPGSGRVEYEFDHVLLGDLPPGRVPAPDPDEIAEIRWVSVPDLEREIAADPRRFAPWLAGVTERLAAHLAPSLSRSTDNPASTSTAAPLTPSASTAAPLAPSASTSAPLTPSASTSAPLTPSTATSAALSPSPPSEPVDPAERSGGR